MQLHLSNAILPMAGVALLSTLHFQHAPDLTRCLAQHVRLTAALGTRSRLTGALHAYRSMRLSWIKWMAEFHYLLTYSNPALAESDPEKETVVDAVKAAVCDNLYLFIQINEDEFEKYLKTFAQDVWTELTKVSLNPGQVSNIHAQDVIHRHVGLGYTQLVFK